MVILEGMELCAFSRIPHFWWKVCLDVCAAINIFLHHMTSLLIDSLINATNKNAIGSFLWCSIINYLTIQNIHLKYSDHHVIRSCGCMPP